jgi:hypothetical protein
LFHQCRELTLRADPFAFGLFQRREIGCGLEFGQGGLLEGFDFVQERHAETKMDDGGWRMEENKTGEPLLVARPLDFRFEIAVRPSRL